jgi:hypothetical protein
MWELILLHCLWQALNRLDVIVAANVGVQFQFLAKLTYKKTSFI